MSLWDLFYALGSRRKTRAFPNVLLQCVHKEDATTVMLLAFDAFPLAGISCSGILGGDVEMNTAPGRVSSTTGFGVGGDSTGVGSGTDFKDPSNLCGTQVLGDIKATPQIETDLEEVLLAWRGEVLALAICSHNPAK